MDDDFLVSVRHREGEMTTKNKVKTLIRLIDAETFDYSEWTAREFQIAAQDIYNKLMDSLSKKDMEKVDMLMILMDNWNRYFPIKIREG